MYAEEICIWYPFAQSIYNKTVSSERLLSALLNWFMGLFGQNKMYCALRKVVIGHVTCSGRNQARKSVIIKLFCFDRHFVAF